MKLTMKALAAGVVFATLQISMAGVAGAADLTERMAPEQAPDVAATPSPWQVRVRALGVITEDNGHVDQVPGSDLSYSDTVVPELDISYYFTDNIAAELILGTTYANISGAGSVSDLGTVGKVWVLPPTLTLQYHFTNLGAFKPYVGAGVNYTIFYNQDAKGPFTDIDVEDTFGVALQAGFDYMLDRHWGINVDVKKLFLEPEWTANDGSLSGKAELNPWLIGTGVTYRF